jgi:hypothetical protein
MVPLDGPPKITNGDGSIDKQSWWMQTNESMCELGFTWLGHLFYRRHLLDHAWLLGRDEHEPWALVSEPYGHHTSLEIEELRRELEKFGAQLLQYPSEQSTHAPGHTLMLVTYAEDIYGLMGATARQIAASCPPLREYEDDEVS